MKPALYTAYVSGTAGSNVILIYMSETQIIGIDAGAGRLIGTAEPTPGGGIRGQVRMILPPGQPLITGHALPDGVTEVPVSFELPPGFEQGEVVVKITTPVGPVNARFEKMMEIA